MKFPLYLCSLLASILIVSCASHNKQNKTPEMIIQEHQLEINKQKEIIKKQRQQETDDAIRLSLQSMSFPEYITPYNGSSYSSWLVEFDQRRAKLSGVPLYIRHGYTYLQLIGQNEYEMYIIYDTEFRPSTTMLQYSNEHLGNVALQQGVSKHEFLQHLQQIIENKFQN